VFTATLSRGLYRTFEIEASATLYSLASTIVAAFGFDFDHAFGFYSNLKGPYYDSPVKYELFTDMGEPTENAGSVERTRAADAFARPGHKMRFLFDYGDEWLFQIAFDGRKPRVPRTILPRVVASAGKAPQQYPPEGEDD
jgi:hypothetical protein